MREASASQSTEPTGTSATACRSSAASASSRGGSSGANGLNVPSLCIESPIVAPKEAREDAAQMAACLMKVPPHGARCELQHLADLGARETVDVEHRHDQALPLGERRQRLLQDLPGVGTLADLQRGGSLAHAFRLGLRAAPHARAPEIGAAVEDDAHQPRAEGTPHLERVEVLVRGEEGLLHEILGILAVSHDAIRDTECLLHVAADQRVERGG